MATYTTTTTVTITCPSCNGGQVKKVGKRNGQQRFQCSCGKRFRANGNVQGKNHNPVQIGMTILNFFSGLSLKRLAVDLKERYGIKEPSRQTMYNWIMDYSHKASHMLKDTKADTSSLWVADENFVWIDRRRAYIFNVMDYRTRFLLATVVSYDKSQWTAEKVLRKALANAKKPPKRIITDKLPSYGPSIKRILPSAVHVPSKGVRGKPNNNRSERVQGTFRARNKTLRCLKTVESGQEYLDGFTTNYNYFRPHSALKGKTPAEAAGIKAPFTKWSDVVESSVVAPKRVRQSRPRKQVLIENLPKDLTARKRVQRARNRAADAAKKKALRNPRKPSDGTVPMFNRVTLKTSPQLRMATKGTRLGRHKTKSPEPVMPGLKHSRSMVKGPLEPSFLDLPKLPALKGARPKPVGNRRL